MRSVALALLAIRLAGLACALAAAPQAAPPNRGGPEGPSAASEPLGDAAYQQQVIGGARSEGQVNAVIQSTWTPEGLDLQREIEQIFKGG
ncbi:MAG TPA: hypothetical protein VK066_21555 [Chloroflexota bacterium]|nr:hypothetical protein [Chloroflexota bacterium]